MEKRTVAELNALVVKGDSKAKAELARRLLEEEGVNKDETKAVSLLEDCVAHGDADAMAMLAKCCALGDGMEYDVERAEALLSDAEKRKNKEASSLNMLINEWKEKERVYLDGLLTK